VYEFKFKAGLAVAVTVAAAAALLVRLLVVVVVGFEVLPEMVGTTGERSWTLDRGVLEADDDAEGRSLWTIREF